MDAAKMTRADLKKVLAAARKEKFDPKPYKNADKDLKAFRASGKELIDMAKRNPDA